MPLDVVVEAEEVICQYRPADNGAGPLWCHGSTVVVSRGGWVYVAALETIAGEKPLNNCRWLLYRRASAGWEVVHRDATGRTREPSPIVLLERGDLLVSANPTLAEPGAFNGPAEPTVFRFDAADPTRPPRRELPVWKGEPAFTEHSYRTVVADGAAGEVLYMQNVGYDLAHMSLLTRDGEWQAAGEIRWPYGGEYPQPQPLRLCYPNVTVRDRAVHFFGVGDIVEPVVEWKEAKHAITGRDWDYVFRRLFYATTPDLSGEPFGEWLEIANFDSTAGATRNCDIWLDPEGSVHLLWVQTNVDERLRDRFFPGVKVRHSLEYGMVLQGALAERRTLAALEEGEEGLVPREARFHIAANGDLLVLGQFARRPAPAAGSQVVYRLARVGLEGGPDWVGVPFDHPMSGTFLTNTVRGGSAPGDLIDMVGSSSVQSPALGYARLRLTGE